MFVLSKLCRPFSRVRRSLRASGRVALSAAALSLLWPAPPAQAIQFGESSTTGQSTVLFPIRSSGTVLGPIGFTYGLRFGNDVTRMLGAAGVPAGLNEAGSVLLDVDFAFAYRHQLANVNFLGKFNPTVGPFLGYRWLGAASGHSNVPTSFNQFLSQGPNITTSLNLDQLHGLHYGVLLDSELPLGLKGFVSAALTSLMGGGWDRRRNGTSVTESGQINPQLTTLPSLGSGISWTPLPFVTLSAGFDLLVLPTGMRNQSATLAPGLTTLRNWSIGATLFNFSI